jgi:competence protein ComEC
LIFDTGPRTGPDSDAGRSVLLPVLRQQRVQQLHTVLISHWHEDHYGGLQSVLQHFPVTQLLLGGGAVAAAQQLPSPQPALAACAAGMQWQLDGVEFLVLHPDEGRYRNLNDQSCVLLIVAGDQRVLLTGDIELAAERALVRRYGAQLRADILQAPHHGSRTSSSALLLEQVRPAWLLVSAGYRNRFGHPSAEVITRAAEAEIAVRRTDYSGALWFVVGEPGGPRLEAEYRQLRRRFWRNIPPDEYGKVAAISAGG